MSCIIRYLLLIFLLITTISFGQFELENAFPNLTFNNPLFLTNAGDGSDRIFVVEQSGKIKVFPNSSLTQISKTFIDITDRIAYGGEMGLLGLAFHPDYENNGFFYVNYTHAVFDTIKTIISRFHVTSNPDSADKTSEFQILTFVQTNDNHNGGWIGFEPNNGYLYIATGDGGGDGDPQNNGQSISKLLGKILRIDIDSGSPYSIPATNPFYDSTNTQIKKEIYAWGLRNPWRCSFDSETDWLWCADVGQNAWEEIDLIENGKNYGWRCYEGNHSYNSTGCNYPEYIYPIWEYSHNPECSITGGYVYRGVSIPELTGKYIYGDYCSRKIWALSYDGINPATNEFLVTTTGAITSFGVDELMELYVVSSNGKIYKFDQGSACLEINTSSGWNLLSVPYLNNDMSASNIFPNTVSEVYAYNNGYYVVDSLLNSNGYWVKYNTNFSFQICGNRINFPIDVFSGWNLIGPFDEIFPVQNISSNPPNIITSPFYGYESVYQIADTLKPGRGYWIKTNSPGTIQFNPSQELNKN